MSSSTRVHLVRHGTPLLNRANRYRGPRRPPGRRRVAGRLGSRE
jgi:broad specificity phosphatase PhoE